MKKHIIVIVAAVGILCLAGVYLAMTLEAPSNVPRITTPVTPQGNEVLIPVDTLSTAASFYTYDDRGVSIRYFLVKDDQDVVRGAMDACDVCYEAKKGYRQAGSAMHCINCGQEFAISGLGTDNTAGGCWPSHLPVEVRNGSAVVQIADLVAKYYLFE